MTRNPLHCRSVCFQRSFHVTCLRICAHRRTKGGLTGGLIDDSMGRLMGRLMDGAPPTWNSNRDTDGSMGNPRLISKLRSRVHMRQNQAKEVAFVDCRYAPLCSQKKGVWWLEAESLIAVSVSVFRVIAMESAVRGRSRSLRETSQLDRRVLFVSAYDASSCKSPLTIDSEGHCGLPPIRLWGCALQRETRTCRGCRQRSHGRKESRRKRLSLTTSTSS
jgi:hypothetical protein